MPPAARPTTEQLKPLIRYLLRKSARPCARHIAAELTASGYPVCANTVSREAYGLGIRLVRGRLPGSKDRAPRKRRHSEVREEVARLYAQDPAAFDKPGKQSEIAGRFGVSRQTVQHHVSNLRQKK